MKTFTLGILLTALPVLLQAQIFDYYGPEPFEDILSNNFSKFWSPNSVSTIENRSYVVLLDGELKHSVVTQDQTNIYGTSVIAKESFHASGATYGSLLSGIFQLVDANTHKDQDEGHTDFVPLSGTYRLNPFLHSYFGLDYQDDETACFSDGGSLQIAEAAQTGFVLIQFVGTSNSAKIKAVSRWEYDAAIDTVVEMSGWNEKWLKMSLGKLYWSDESSATPFFIADANDLIDLVIEEGSAFNPLNVSYQVNQTAELPADLNDIIDSKLVTDLAMEVEDEFESQFGHSESATSAAESMIETIEETLSSVGESMRYPKEFYLAAREAMLAQKVASTDIYGARLGYNTIEHVYFTNAIDDFEVPHPFMVIVSHAVSTRPNQLVDVCRPPGATEGVGYAESAVTRQGKLGEFIVKIPLKDYGLIESLLDNDLSPYGDLASDYDSKQGTTTTKDVYNYAGLASNGIAIDGVTIYPAYNNNLRFAVEDAEVTHSGIHVGGGLELHYHADGHAYSQNGIALYNSKDFIGKDHPPVVGFAYDGIALFGRYENNYSSMVGYGLELDEFGGHDHGDGFGYHYHAHTQSVTSSIDGTNFDEHILLVGAWKGDINDIPGFNEGKLNQFRDVAIARYLGAPYELGTILNVNHEVDLSLYPNPVRENLTIKSAEEFNVTISTLQGQVVGSYVHKLGETIISMKELNTGVYLMTVERGTTIKTIRLIKE
ncbi:MAG: T9SS type A sorting domain-containing protein [bacterium]|nr:T9SS type A sorting domain-containing protein [bacterium]